MKNEFDPAVMELASETAAKPKAMWRFGLSLWSIPGVKDQSLEWQERFGFDASFFVFLCWVVLREARFLDTDQLDSAMGAVRQWRSMVIEPTRNARKAAKESCSHKGHPQAAAISKLLRQAELRAELIEQETLLEWFENASSSMRSDDIQSALETQIKLYITRLTDDFDECAEAGLGEMCGSIFMCLPKMPEQ